ncbi:heme peroxidase [Panaeolus papilionaceus]|nr:heme peroxidase [Panaeolus papilionaceus]
MKSCSSPYRLLLLLLLSFSPKPLLVSGYKWPGDPRHDALERLIYEGVNPAGTSMFDLLTNCTFLQRGEKGQIQGTTTAATWLRMAYHDSATFNITDQTGGLDASIHFELDRPENIGNGMLSTRNDFSLFPSKYVSMADIIAFGAAGAVASCGGPIMSLRGGRVDAKQAGNPGVPEPHQDLQTHVEKFRLQGFNSTEMIELVACGHTFGGVESKDFPDIAAHHVNGLGAFSIAAPFDNTSAFDVAVVSQYLDGSTQNLLVVGKNVTTRSDFRIFNSDGNVTMKALSDPATFQKRCGLLFEKMIDTVPAGVELTDPIDVIPEKPHYFTGLNIGNNSVSFSTSLRLVQSKSDPVLDKSRVSLHWCDRYGDDANCKSGFSNRIKGAGDMVVMHGSPMLVRSEREFRLYPFKALINPSRSISRFWWELEQDGGAEPRHIDNEGEKYPVLQDDIIYVTSLSSTIFPGVGDGSAVFTSLPLFMVVGIRDTIEPTRVYLDIFDNTHTNRPPGSVTNDTFDLARNTSLTGAPGYNLYSALINPDIGGAPTFDFFVESPGKKSALTFQHQPTEGSIPDVRLIVDPGKVEKVPYNGPLISAISTSSSSSSTPTPSMPSAGFATFAPFPIMVCTLVTSIIVSGSLL